MKFHLYVDMALFKHTSQLHVCLAPAAPATCKRVLLPLLQVEDLERAVAADFAQGRKRKRHTDDKSGDGNDGSDDDDDDNDGQQDMEVDGVESYKDGFAGDVKGVTRLKYDDALGVSRGLILFVVMTVCIHCWKGYCIIDLVSGAASLDCVLIACKCM